MNEWDCHGPLDLIQASFRTYIIPFPCLKKKKSSMTVSLTAKGRKLP